MFKRSTSGSLILVLIVLGLILFFLLNGCAAPTPESSSQDTSSYSQTEEVVENESVTRYEIVFNGRSITGKVDEINSFGENILIYDIDGDVYRTSWQNVLLTEN